MDLLFPHVASNDVYFGGLAFFNLDSDPADVTVTVLDTEGEPMVSGTWTLAPGARQVRLISQLFPALPPVSKRYVRIRSTRMIAAYAVFGTHSLTALSAIPSQ